ncbi:MAG TPA: hypothetical protein VHL58_18175 [Thermoanaerobaculia bacterium]|nr:hypothetical protein [Thermoanaerobaculia bacterium]
MFRVLRNPFLVLLATAILFVAVSSQAQEQPSVSQEQIDALKQKLDQLLQQASEIKKQIDGLKGSVKSSQMPAAAKETQDQRNVEAVPNPSPSPASEAPSAEGAGTPPPVANSQDQSSVTDASVIDNASPALPLPAPEAPTASPITIVTSAGGKNFLNLSLDGLFAAGTSTARDVAALQTGGHDPAQRGFTVQNVETVFDGAVDPYFRGQANLVLQITPEGGTQVELEEAYATTTSLPKGLQVKAGQFFTEFGRLNPQHPHSWDFVDQPLVNGRFFGPDGLRSAGARVSWLLPTSFYSEAFVALQNSQGETATSFRSVPGDTLFGRTIQERAVSSISDLLIVPRYTASFDLSDTQTLLLGGSAALGPNGTGDSGRTRIYGLDGFWKWKPSNAFQGFPFVKIQGEVMRRSASVAAVPQQTAAATFKDWGGYLQVNWGYKAGHVLGFRVDRVDGDQGDPHDDALSPRWRLSPALTWFPTEFSKLRLQYNLDRSDAFQKTEHSLWLQLEFLLGAHAAHKF